MNRSKITAVLVVLLLGTAALVAHENYRIVGTVIKLTGTTLDVKQTKDGKTISMELTQTSRVLRDKKKVKPADLKSGTSVVVDARGDNIEELDVVEIRIVPAPARK